MVLRSEGMALRFDVSPIGKIERTPQGGIRVPATLTRTGVFEYVQPDGSIRREYRAPEDVFAPGHLDALRAAPVTNQHPDAGRVDSETWRALSVGHVGEDVRQDGSHVAATLYVQDAETIRQIEQGQRNEISLGYDQEYVPGPGVTPDGERYDGRQTQIKPNHAALVPRGRAGRTVGLRLDADGNEAPGGVLRSPCMLIKIAGKEYTAGTPEAQAAIDAVAARADAAEAAVARVRLDSLRVKAQSVGVTPRADATSDEIMLDVLKKIAPGVAVEGASPDFIAGAFLTAISLKLEMPTEETADPVAEDEPKPVAPAGPSAASVRSDVVDSRAPKGRSDADEGPGPAELARIKMVKDGASRR